MTTVHSTRLGRRAAPAPLPAQLLPDLAYTPEVARNTAHLYERVSRVIPPIEWPGFAPYVKAINDLKKARNAVVLAHNHPSGTVQPSRADEALTHTLKAALSLIDVRVLDHVIVAPGAALSMAEQGLI